FRPCGPQARTRSVPVAHRRASSVPVSHRDVNDSAPWATGPNGSSGGEQVFRRRTGLPVAALLGVGVAAAGRRLRPVVIALGPRGARLVTLGPIGPTRNCPSGP